MLVLTRRPGQSVYIGGDVKITLVEIKGSQVRIGIDAPSSVRIYREEIYLQIQEENKLAASETISSPKEIQIQTIMKMPKKIPGKNAFDGDDEDDS
jgi:carbon storage regulator